jgi:hypothetical protein
MHREGQQSVKLRHRVKGCQRVFRAPLRLLQGCGGSTPGGRAGAYFFLRREYDCQAHCGVRGAKAEILRLSYDMQIPPFWPFLRVFENPSRQASAGKNDRWASSEGLLKSPTTIRTQRRRCGAHIYRSSKTAAHNPVQQRFAVRISHNTDPTLLMYILSFLRMPLTLWRQPCGAVAAMRHRQRV